MRRCLDRWEWSKLKNYIIAILLVGLVLNEQSVMAATHYKTLAWLRFRSNLSNTAVSGERSIHKVVIPQCKKLSLRVKALHSKCYLKLYCSNQYIHNNNGSNDYMSLCMKGIAQFSVSLSSPEHFVLVLWPAALLLFTLASLINPVSSCCRQLVFSDKTTGGKNRDESNTFQSF